MFHKVTLDSWHARLRCGKEISGRQHGPFRNVKDRRDIIDLWVETRAGTVHAVKERGRMDGVKGFDFYVRVSVEDKGIVEKKWKLVTLYEKHKIIKYVLPDGRNWIEKEVL